MVVGIDEAGRGPLAGCVVACAMHLLKEPPFKVKDSKALSQSKREEAFSWLCANALFSVAMATEKEIDKHNILEATFIAFNRAIKKLLSKAPHLKRAHFIVDGNLFKTDLDLNYTCIKEADKKVCEVSCASVVAKVSRDYLMSGLSFLYPQWNFAKHKGYPTLEHFSLIKRHKLTPFHRKSFSPCKKK